MWQPTVTLTEPSQHERRVVWLALDNGEAVLADASAYVETSAEYHASTGVYLGQSIQDAWSGFVGWNGDVFERDDAGWHCYRHPHADDRKVRIAVIGWLDAIAARPPVPAAMSASQQ